MFQLDIAGERIRLVSIAEDLHKTFSLSLRAILRPTCSLNLPSPFKETEAFILASLEAFGEANNLQLVILDKTTGEFLGCCGLHGRDDVKNPEIGIWLKGSAHGKALGKEAVWTLVDWAQDNVRIDSLSYPVDKRNQPSRNIPISLGGQVVGEQVAKGRGGQCARRDNL